MYMLWLNQWDTSCKIFKTAKNIIMSWAEVRTFSCLILKCCSLSKLLQKHYARCKMDRMILTCLNQRVKPSKDVCTEGYTPPPPQRKNGKLIITASYISGKEHICRDILANNQYLLVGIGRNISSIFTIQYNTGI